MRAPIVFSAFAISVLFADIIQPKAAFAHYMIGTISEDHAHQDIDDAMAMGLDGFALNIGDPRQDFVITSLSDLFGYAAYRGFKLFISMDLSGDSSGYGLDDYHTILANYLGNSAWYLGPNGLPVVSTFLSGGLEITKWRAWKMSFATRIYFIPNFDDTQGYYQAAAGWWSYWGGLVDGLFSWESAWPEIGSSTQPGDVSLDQTVIHGAWVREKGYMIALSALQYKNAYNVNLYRLGDLNLPTRMWKILSMSTQPDLLQIITWNDGPESHYIGNLWPEANTNPQGLIYATQPDYPHTAWQPLITSFIHAWKAGGSASSMSPPSGATIGAMWYKTILQGASCPNGVTKPNGFDSGRDALNWAVVPPAGPSGMKVRVTSNNVVLQTVGISPGLNYGSPAGVQAGEQKLELLDAGGEVVMTSSTGKPVSSRCPDGIFNMNYQVVELS